MRGGVVYNGGVILVRLEVETHLVIFEQDAVGVRHTSFRDRLETLADAETLDELPVVHVLRPKRKELRAETCELLSVEG